MNLSYSSHQALEKHPEKVLQFGTGVLLRGLCDFLIDKANKQGVFNGSIVVVKSLPGSLENFRKQDNLYTVCLRGIEQKEDIKENVICESISRVLSATEDWEAILETAINPSIELVISNTTEVGLSFVKETSAIPESYPGKLTSWLYTRFKANLNGLIIIPTELIVDNGAVLKNIVLEQIKEQELGEDFRNWIEEKNTFCSSLVDRIIPGKPKGQNFKNLQTEIGYQDDLLLIAETYKLWAIEGSGKTAEILSFAQVDPGVIIAKDISQYRELKLRMLNAPHTLMCAISFLSGFETVKSTLEDDLMEKYISNLMLTELASSMPAKIDRKVIQRYGFQILDRFRNPYLDHQWHSISFQYTMKLKLRAIPLLIRYYEVFGRVPHYFARGMAAYLLFMKATKEKDGQYFGENKGVEYQINDDQAKWYFESWKSGNAEKVTKLALSNEDFWDYDLSKLPNFEASVSLHLSNMMMIGVKEVVSALNVFS